MLHRVIIILVCFYEAYSIFDIEKFGAVAHSDEVKAQFQNQKAIMAAIKAASESTNQRVVRIPAKTFYTMPFKIQNVNNLTIEIFGRVAASKSVRYWSREGPSNTHVNFIQINNCTDIKISGGGKIDGRGHHWWILVYLNDKKFMKSQSDRPHLINLVNCQNIKVHDLILKNSAQFHIKLDHCHNAEIFNLNIKVNTTAQFNLFKQHIFNDPIPMFPFNTDGIDPSGGNMHIYNLSVQNFDDVVVPKPSHDDDCTRDMLVENVEVRLGVGMSIGSVPPHQGGSCIRNITFRDVTMKRPFKGIYIKTNPGVKGWGNVTNIYYKNISMDQPIWWAIYLGPQQMRQPGGAGPGCMVYPFDPKGTCSTQPLVTLTNITLQDITVHKSLLYPVTLRCNVSNPCTQINFINVKTDSWQIGQKQKGYVCQFVSGKSMNTYPRIECLNDIDEKEISNNNVNSQKLPQLRYDIEDIQNFFENRNKDLSHVKAVWMRMLQELQQAVKQVKYEDSQDDEFIYDFKQIQMEFNTQNPLLDHLVFETL